MKAKVFGWSLMVGLALAGCSSDEGTSTLINAESETIIPLSHHLQLQDSAQFMGLSIGDSLQDFSVLGQEYAVEKHGHSVDHITNQSLIVGGDSLKLTVFFSESDGILRNLEARSQALPDSIATIYWQELKTALDDKYLPSNASDYYASWTTNDSKNPVEIGLALVNKNAKKALHLWFLPASSSTY